LCPEKKLVRWGCFKLHENRKTATGRGEKKKIIGTIEGWGIFIGETMKKKAKGGVAREDFRRPGRYKRGLGEKSKKFRHVGPRPEKMAVMTRPGRGRRGKKHKKRYNRKNPPPARSSQKKKPQDWS